MVDDFKGDRDNCTLCRFVRGIFFALLALEIVGVAWLFGWKF